MNKKILAVSNNTHSPWLGVVETVTQSIGQLDICSEDDIYSELQKKEFDLILIESSSIKGNIVALVSQLVEICPETPTVVVTTSPTWQNARDIFKAGAADYVRSTLVKEKLLSFLSDASR